MNDPISNDDLLDELADDFVTRKQAGESPKVSDYCLRYPALEAEIRELFPTLDLLENVKPESGLAENRRPPQPERIGEYRVLRVIGHGGMGVVYEAEHESLGRRVALKVVAPRVSLDDRARARFLREARAVAKLHHTNIVPLFEVGEDDGQLFLVMQYIAGQSLDHVLAMLGEEKHATPESRRDPSNADSRLSGAPRPGRGIGNGAYSTVTRSAETGSDNRCHFHWIAAIGLQAADALEYAHQRGIIHRDIKPSNLILDEGDVVWLTDFGLAKTDDEELTQTGDILGTLRYMAPERFQRDGDERADVYGLGLTLYEMLTLRPAFSSSDRVKLMDEICRSDLVRISSLNPQVPRDLETIVLKACDRERTSRYPSAGELAEDLRRFLSDEPIKARRASAFEQFGRWARRNRQLAGALLAIAALLAVVAAGSSFALFREANHRHELETANKHLRHKLYAYQIQRASAAYRDDSLDMLREYLDECPEELRDWEWYRCKWLARPRHALSIGGFERPVFTPDGRLLVAAGPRQGKESHAALVWDASTGQRKGPPIFGESNLTCLAMSADGKRLATGFENGTVTVWDFASRRQVWSEPAHTEKVDGVAFSVDGSRMASVSWDQTLKVIDADTGELVFTVGPVGHRLRCVEFSPSREQVAAACYQAGTASAAKVFSSDDGKLLFELRGHADSTESIAYSPDGANIITGSADRTVKLWDATNGSELRTYLGHDGNVESVAFSPDGDQFASGSQDRTLRIWDVATGEETLRYQTGNAVAWLSFSGDGRRIATFGGSRINVWEIDGSADVFILRHGAKLRDCEFSPDGRRVASSGRDGVIRVWDLATGRLLRALHGHEADVDAIAWHPRGRFIASASSDQTARLWDADSGRPEAVFPIPGKRLLAVAFSPDGARLACGTRAGSVSVFDVESRKLLLDLDDESQLKSLAWSPGGRYLAIGHAIDTATLWDTRTGTIARTLEAGESGITFTPDGGQLIASLRNGAVRRSDISGEGPRRDILGHQGTVDSLAVSPNGRRIVSGGYYDSLVKIWDMVSGEELLALRGHRSGIRALSFSADGTTIASASDDGTVAVWESTESSARWRTRHLVSKASRIVERLFDSHTFAADVLHALHSDDGLDPEVRDVALEIAARRGDDALLLFKESWSVTMSPDLGEDAYELARRKAAAACEVVPDSPAFRTALGVAQYRLGGYHEALENLTRAREDAIIKSPVRFVRNADVQKAIYPVNQSFLAMVLCRLDREEDAREEFARLRGTLKDPRWAHYPDASLAEREAEALMTPLTRER